MENKRLALQYRYAADDGTGHAICGDLLFGIGELVGAGQRCCDSTAVKKCGPRYRSIRFRQYQWYLDMKENFPFHTSGFGMGTECFLLWVSQRNDTRECQLISRFNGRAEYI